MGLNCKWDLDFVVSVGRLKFERGFGMDTWRDSGLGLGQGGMIFSYLPPSYSSYRDIPFFLYILSLWLPFSSVLPAVSVLSFWFSSWLAGVFVILVGYLLRMITGWLVFIFDSPWLNMCGQCDNHFPYL